MNSLSVAAENASAAESRIRDTDMAKEMTTFTRSQILHPGRRLDAGPGQLGPAVGAQAPRLTLSA